MSIASSNPIKRKTLFCLNDTRATYVYFKSFWDFHLNRDSKLQTLCSCRHCVVRFMTSFRWESYYFSIEKIEHKYLLNFHKLLKFFLLLQKYFLLNIFSKWDRAIWIVWEWEHLRLKSLSFLDLKHQFCVYFLKNFNDLTFV